MAKTSFPSAARRHSRYVGDHRFAPRLRSPFGALRWHEPISAPVSTIEAIVSEAGVVAIAGSRDLPIGGAGFIQTYDTRTGRFL